MTPKKKFYWRGFALTFVSAILYIAIMLSITEVTVLEVETMPKTQVNLSLTARTRKMVRIWAAMNGIPRNATVSAALRNGSRIMARETGVEAAFSASRAAAIDTEPIDAAVAGPAGELQRHGYRVDAGDVKVLRVLCAVTGRTDVSAVADEAISRHLLALASREGDEFLSVFVKAVALATDEESAE